MPRTDSGSQRPGRPEDLRAPFGDMKHSGAGRDWGNHALKCFTGVPIA